MTRQSTKQRGISLVEVVLTLGISSLLIATILTGRNSVRSQAQFSDGMERIKEQILAVKSDANTGKNKLGDGASTDYLLLGESLLFRTTAKTSMQISNVMCKVAVDLQCGTTVTTSSSSRSTIATPWNIQYIGYTAGSGGGNPIEGNLTLVFIRDDSNGSFTGAWHPAELQLGGRDTREAILVNQGEVTLHFVSPDGRKAGVIVNPATGTVTRKML